MEDQTVIASARELGIGDYRSVLRRRWRWVAFTPLGILLIVGALTWAQDRVYEATAEVLVLTDANHALFPATATTAERLQRNPFAEEQFVSSQAFRDAAGFDSTDPTDPTNPSGLPSVTYELTSANPNQDLVDAGILQFHARANTAAGAAAVANDHAEAYVLARHQRDVTQTNGQLEDLDARLGGLQEQSAASDAQLASLRSELQNTELDAARLQLQTDVTLLEEQRDVVDLAGQVRETLGEIAAVSQVATELNDTSLAARVHNPAIAPTAPASPDVVRNILYAVLAGLVLGVAAAIARDLLDETASDPIYVADATGTPVLGAVGVLPENIADVASLVHRNGYQTVLNSLSLRSGRRPNLRVIAVTSATASVGKTETVTNLAQVEASVGSRVLILDGNPIVPSVTSRLGKHARRIVEVAVDPDGDVRRIVVDDGLAARSSSTDELSGFRSPTIDVVDLFSSGVLSRDLVGTAELERLLEKFKELYDLVLIDTHAVLTAVDVRPLITLADAAIVVYEPEGSRVDDLGRTIELLRGAGVHVVGLVANRAPVAEPGYQYRHLLSAAGP
ncbi:MAG: AAA family ATPase [Acidimicrobiia bacterium]|nr:AAA family ATPase [Acidimicrobiia bacterium]